MKNINLKIKPYSLWLSYNIINQGAIQDMLPPGMSLANIKISDDNECSQPRLLFNCYSIDSFWMKGSRLEIMTVAKYNQNFHFVVLECITNVLQWDPVNRIRGPNGRIKFSYIQDKLFLLPKVFFRTIFARYDICKNILLEKINLFQQ